MRLPNKESSLCGGLRRNGMWVRDPEDSVCLHGPLDARDAELKWHEYDTSGLPIGQPLTPVWASTCKYQA